MSKVSVLMPAYNAGNLINEAINTIVQQTHSNWELLVLDDGSTDDTFQKANSIGDERIQVIQNKSNQGYLKSCNKLFEMASGEFVTFLDADDTCSKDRLKRCLKEIETSGADFLTTDHTRFWNDGKRESVNQPIDFSRLSTDPNYYPSICGATIFVKKELVEKIAGYASVFDKMGAEDYHWLFRLSLGGKGIHLSEPLYRYRQHEGQIRNRSTPENFIAHDLDKAIRKKLIVDKIDLLDPEFSDNLKALKIELLQPFSEDPTLIMRHSSIQLLNAGNRFEAVRKSIEAISRSPLLWANWKGAAYLFYVAMRRTVGF